MGIIKKLVFAAIVIIMIVVLPRAKGELIYDTADSPAKVDDRESLRQVLTTSEKAQQTLQARPAAVTDPVEATAPIPVPQQALTAPVVTSAPATEDVQNFSKTELLRRERVREEVKNEDILQERLEELRLRDEKRRTDQLLSAQPNSDQGVAPDSGVPAPAVGGVQTEGVVAPITERPGQPGTAPLPPGAGQSSASAGYGQQDQWTTSSTSAVGVSTTDYSNTQAGSQKTQFSLGGEFGLASMSNVPGYNVNAHYSAGVKLGVTVSDNIVFLLGYRYSQYGIAVQPGSPYPDVPYGYSIAGQSQETFNLNQNVFELGLRLYVLGQDSRFRPFVGAGGGYAKSYLNYPSSVVGALNTYGGNSFSQDYESSQFLGNLNVGVDVKVSPTVALTAAFNYYDVLSSSENQPLNSYAFYGYSPGYYPGFNYSKAVAGGSLAQANFYMLTGGVSFLF
jgi:hypothetical protein